ncbi:geranylgeranyl pyrophosphate synthase [Pseudomonas syringae]|uniref:Geranylgeranyl diphosphate synthase, type II n=1 Tax=Pseudomonas syringae TaxID=317 RepID=A0AB37ZWI5_PSESX|nr:polyprenyl synthetase family protein [Pseudomonas syringae]MBI6669654.1 polyprenyl synthetase family protein [Pseudomonas syringae]MBI6679665.1 polyprenyl synthetase family protein [Pseudomonas syringae]MBI6839633.1 polyprenyl synthetase family protein [Pseudomonas syringae]NAP22216.1 polyprenyl synthetase family protein [Pseudomonas syringae]NAQ17825.1 polyprenyl synthetase family protein [Pseudomonas syringae]
MTKDPGAIIDNGFNERLSRIRASIETRLDELLPESGNERDLVALAMRESTLAPGKRMRPILLMLAAEGLGHEGTWSLDLGCAVELIHAASLVLDDMPCMDNASLRRGRPTVHLKFGEDVAILTAVALLSRAFGVIASISDLSPAIKTQLVELASNAVGMQGLVRGQYQDLREGQQSRSPKEIAMTNTLKTGVLFSAIVDMAWLISDREETVRPTLRTFAMELGQAFQMYDDLRDKCPDSDKDQGKDEGKSTFVSLYGEDKVTEQLQIHLSNAELNLRRVFGDDDMIAGYMKMVFKQAATTA